MLCFYGAHMERSGCLCNFISEQASLPEKGQFLGRVNRGKTYIFFLLAIFIVIEQILQQKYLFAKKKKDCKTYGCNFIEAVVYSP